MRFDHGLSFILSLGLFIILVFSGCCLSAHKTLWTDELFTQHYVIDSCSFKDILISNTPDGNRNPLFYLVQKAVAVLFRFHLPDSFKPGDSHMQDAHAETVMRIPSNVYMSLALSLIFYFLTRFYSVYAALYALVVAFVSPMVWMYWVEARPYSLWFLLTTIQLLLLSALAVDPKPKLFKPLLIVHFLLAFTISASIFQISIGFLMMLWKGKFTKMQLALAWVLPLTIGLLYIFLVPVFKTKTYDFFPNLWDAVMPERLYVYLLYAVVAFRLPKQTRNPSNLFFLPVFILFLISGLFMLTVDLYTKNSQFGFFSRYLIFITPADILMYTLASYDLRRWSRPTPWVCLNVSILLAGLLIIRGMITYRSMLAFATYLHAPG